MSNSRMPLQGSAALVRVGKRASHVRIEFDLEDETAMQQARDHVERAVQDTVASINRSRGHIDFHGVSEAHVRLIARRAARLALLMDRNPDRER